MAISYNKTNWVNNETKLNAENLNHIEDGIKNVTDEVNKIEDGTVVAEKANKDGQGLVIHETYETKDAANVKLAEAKTYADDKVAGLDVAEAGSDGSYIEKISETDGKITATVQEFDSTPTNNSNKGVKSGGVKSYVDNAIADLDAAEVGGNGKYIKAISETDGTISATEETMDTTPTVGSNKAVTSGGVKTELDKKQATLVGSGEGQNIKKVNGQNILGDGDITNDDELSDLSENAVQNKVVKAALDEKANKDGNYPTMTAGAADNLTPYDEESGADQDEPFLFQATGTGNGSLADFATGALALMKEKRGNSVVVNQLAKDFNSTNWSYFLAGQITLYFDTSANKVTVTTLTSGSGGDKYMIRPDYTTNVIANHKLLIFVSYALIQGTNLTPVVEVSSNGVYSLSNISGNLYYALVSATTNMNDGRVYFKTNGNKETGDSWSWQNLIIIDLTQWFGLNDNIPADLLAHPENFFRYYQGSLAYNAGEIVNANSRYIKCIGRQQWDEEWEMGNILSSTGQEQEVPSQYRLISKNYIRVIPNITYHFYGGLNGGATIYAYDKDYNYIGYIFDSSINTTFTIPSNCTFIKFQMYSEYGQSASSVYQNNITISLYYEGESGYDQYYPYEVLTDNDTGTEELKSAGSVADSKTPDGTVNRVVGSVDLGTLNYTYESSWGADSDFYVEFSLAKAPINNDTKANLLCALYNNVTRNEMYNNATNMIISLLPSGVLKIRNTSYTDVATFKTAMSGVILYYEIATPTTEQGTPFSENLVIDDFGSMEFAGTSGVPQGNLIFYPVDYKAFIDTLYDYTEGTPSDIALKSDLTVVEEKIGAKLPECPTDTDGTYVLKATVSGGVVTYTWVLEE